MLRQLKSNQMMVITRLLEFEKVHALEIRHRLRDELKCPTSHIEFTNQTIFQELNDTLKDQDSKNLTENSIWSTFNILALKKLKVIRKAMKQNFNLTEQEFEKLRYELKSGNEDFFEHIFLSHFEDCIKFLMRKFKIEHHVAYDFTMETLIEFRKKLIQDKIKYGNIRFLFTQMASQYYIKFINAEKKADKVEVDNVNVSSSEEKLILREDLNILSKSIEKLGDKCKSILKSFYYDNVSLQDYSKVLEIPAPTVRKQKERCLYKLKNLFKQHSY